MAPFFLLNGLRVRCPSNLRNLRTFSLAFVWFCLNESTITGYQIQLTSRRCPTGRSISNVGVKKFWFSRPSQLHPLCTCVNRNDKIVFFIHVHIYCTRNGDHLILLIKTSNDHIYGMLPQTIINTFKKCKGKGLKRG